jgi:hypothetical protein
MSTYPLNEGKARSRKTAHMPPSWLDTRSFPSNSSSTMSYKTMARDDTGKSVYLRTLFSTTTTTISSSHKTTSSLTPTSYPNREQNRNQNRYQTRNRTSNKLLTSILPHLGNTRHNQISLILSLTTRLSCTRDTSQTLCLLCQHSRHLYLSSLRSSPSTHEHCSLCARAVLKEARK